MVRIIQRELYDILPQLPSITQLGEKGLGLHRDSDLFICSLGFEPRCLNIPSIASKNDIKYRFCLFLEYSTNAEDNKANLPELQKQLFSISGNVKKMETDSTEFSNKFRAFIESIPPKNDGTLLHITLDISVMANRLIMRCIKVLLELNVELLICYSEAHLYHPTMDDFNKNIEEWMSDESLVLERGVSDVEISIDYPGNHDVLPNAIILFPSFKAERSKAVIALTDPSLLSGGGGNLYWVLGLPHLSVDNWRLEAMRKINAISPEQPQYQVSTFDYKETMNALETIYKKVEHKCNITLSPIGSKLQALGASFFCFLHQDVRVVFAVPKEYNASLYSEGCKETWVINFGPTRELRELLNSIGLLSITD